MPPKKRSKNGEGKKRDAKPAADTKSEAELFREWANNLPSHRAEGRRPNPALPHWLEQLGDASPRAEGGFYDAVLFKKHEQLAKLTPRSFLALMTLELDRRRMGDDGNPDAMVPPGLYEAACEAVGVLVGAREPSGLSQLLADVGRGVRSNDRDTLSATFRQLGYMVGAFRFSQGKHGADLTAEFIAAIEKDWPNPRRVIDPDLVRTAFQRESLASTVVDVAAAAKLIPGGIRDSKHRATLVGNAAKVIVNK